MATSKKSHVHERTTPPPPPLPLRENGKRVFILILFFVVAYLLVREVGTGASIPFFGLGGGGGAKVRKISKIFGALYAQSCSIKVCAQARRKIWSVCLVMFYVKSNGFVVPYDDFEPILALHNYYEFFKLSKLLGGGVKTICFAPPIFSLGANCPLPPPPPGSTPLGWGCTKISMWKKVRGVPPPPRPRSARLAGLTRHHGLHFQNTPVEKILP